MNTRKKSKLILLLIMLCVSLVACKTNGEGKLKDENLVIGIVQLAEHPALDDARMGFEENLEDFGIHSKIIYKNAQGDIPTSLSIAQKFVKDEVDLIYAIGTSAAQSAKQATDNIPVLFSAVTDPVKTEIVHDWNNVGGNITGTSDQGPTHSQLKMFKELDPDIKTIGVLYNTDELNSGIEIKNVKKLTSNEGIEVKTIGVNNINDIPQSLDSLISKVDAVYCLSDNLIASSVGLVSKKLIENNMISISAEESQVEGGILLTDGLSYYELGKQTARMAKEILIDGKSPGDIPVEVSKKTKKLFNEETLKALGLDKNNKLFKNAIKVN